MPKVAKSAESSERRNLCFDNIIFVDLYGSVLDKETNTPWFSKFCDFFQNIHFFDIFFPNSFKMRCHYEVLGVEQTADQDELKKAYRKQVISSTVYSL